MTRFRLPVLCFATCLAAAAYGQEGGATSSSPKWDLAPGILRTIESDPRSAETFTGPLTLPINAKPWNPSSFPVSETLAAMSKNVVLRRPIWNLEFSFKPLRMITVRVPQPDGTLQPRLIWYLVYRLRYLGRDLQSPPEDNTLVLIPEDLQLPKPPRKFVETFPASDARGGAAHRFYPQFVLGESQELNKSYLDRIIPAAIEPISRREFSPNRTENPSGKLYNSVEISTIDVPLSTPDASKPVWGVVTWENVDPRIDYFSIYVRGLSNAFLVEIDDQGKAGKMTHKTLKLNFWRPGDSVEESEEEIKFGIPILPTEDGQAEMLRRYRQEKRLDYLWLYQ